MCLFSCWPGAFFASRVDDVAWDDGMVDFEEVLC